MPTFIFASCASCREHVCLNRGIPGYSSIGSNEKSALLSAPQTDHLFRSLLLLRLVPRGSIELRLFDSIVSPSSTFSLPTSSSSKAASSASGVSSMVSSELMDGDRDRKEVGVLGILEAELSEYAG
jgi:hypothetical protein